MNAFLKKHSKITLFSHRFLMKFRYFLGIDFRIDFFYRFLMKKGPKMRSKLSAADALFILMWRPFSHLFRDLVFYVPLLSATTHFGSHLAHFGLPLATLWITFGFCWLTFGSLLVPFGFLLAYCWYPLAHFWCPLAMRWQCFQIS